MINMEGKKPKQFKTKQRSHKGNKLFVAIADLPQTPFDRAHFSVLGIKSSASSFKSLNSVPFALRLPTVYALN